MRVTGQKFGRSRRQATFEVEAFFRGETGEDTKIMRPSSVWLALSPLLLILNSSSCDQDEVCETESCGENELSDVSYENSFRLDNKYSSNYMSW